MNLHRPHVVVIAQPSLPRRRLLRIFSAGLILFICASFATNMCRSANDAIHQPVAQAGRSTHAFFLLDRTGSMATMSDAVRDGFNEYVKTQQEQTGQMRLTLVQFDSVDPCEVVIEAAEIHSVQPLSRFDPRGSTPLYDAIARVVALAKASVRPEETVALIVFTDGGENASREYDQRSIFKLIEEQKEAGWTFVFLGANQDSYASGGKLGYTHGSTSNFAATPAGAQAAFNDLRSATRKWRSDVSAGTYNRMKADSWMDSYTSRSAEANMQGARRL